MISQQLEELMSSGPPAKRFKTEHDNNRQFQTQDYPQQQLPQGFAPPVQEAEPQSARTKLARKANQEQTRRRAIKDHVAVLRSLTGCEEVHQVEVLKHSVGKLKQFRDWQERAIDEITRLRAAVLLASTTQSIVPQHHRQSSAPALQQHQQHQQHPHHQQQQQQQQQQLQQHHIDKMSSQLLVKASCADPIVDSSKLPAPSCNVICLRTGKFLEVGSLMKEWLESAEIVPDSDGDYNVQQIVSEEVSKASYAKCMDMLRTGKTFHTERHKVRWRGQEMLITYSLSLVLDVERRPYKYVCMLHPIATGAKLLQHQCDPDANFHNMFCCCSDRNEPQLVDKNPDLAVAQLSCIKGASVAPPADEVLQQFKNPHGMESFMHNVTNALSAMDSNPSGITQTSLDDLSLGLRDIDYTVSDEADSSDVESPSSHNHNPFGTDS